MDARLEVEIGADIKDLQSKVNSATKDLKDFGNDSKKNLNNFSKSTTTATKSMANFKKGAISGDSALTSFSRTIQDAPFGIMGVSNNITNLTEQFGYLKAKTGSSGSALKAMLSSLKGFGGISLLISVATSALLVFGDKIFATKNKVKELRKEQEDLTKSLEDYAFGLEAVNRANLKGVQSAQKEIVTFKLLSSQVNDTTLSLNKRKGAIEELRKKYPDYLKDMSDEKILNGGLSTVYDTLTTSIIKRAKATASMNAIIKNSESLLNLESQLSAKNNELKKKELFYQTQLAKVQKGGSYKTGTKDFELYVESLKKGIGTIKDEINTLTGQKQGIELSNIDLETNVSDLGGIAEKFVPKVENALNSKKLNYTPEIDVKLPKVEILETIDLNTDDWIGDSPFNWAEYFKLKDLDTQKNLLNEKMLEVNAQMGSLIQGQLANTFSGIGQAIGNGLSQGTNVLAAVGGALISGIGNLIASMGDKLIQLGTAAVLAGTVTKLFGAIAGVGAGMAAIAGGIALKGIGTGIANFGGAGQSNAQTGGGTNNNANFSSGLSGGYSNNNGGNVVFQIAGDKLIGVLKNTLDNNSSLGGNIVIG